MEFDIIIVGAGPSGCASAIELCKMGYKTCIVEKKSRIGIPVQCAEYVPMGIFNEVKVGNEVFKKKINNLIIHCENEEFRLRMPGYVINRENFDLNLAIQSIKRGAKIFVKSCFLSKKKKQAIINGLGKVKYNFIIGADGPKSSFSGVKQKLMFGYQGTYPLKYETDDAHIYFNDYIERGYGWFFPKSSSANVGISLPLHKKNYAFNILNKFAEKMKNDGFIENAPLRITSGYIPIGGVVKSNENDVILVGDAGGFTHPLTGGGIFTGVISGKCSAEYIKMKMDNYDITFEDVWKMHLGRFLYRGLKMRNVFDDLWGKIDLKDLVRKTWLGDIDVR